MNKSSEYWNTVLKNRQRGENRLWRHYSDRLNAELFNGWLSDEPGGRILKTDMFDEARSEGLCPLLRHSKKQFFGIDVSPEVMKSVMVKHPGLTGVVADVRCLPFPDGTFDIVISNSTLDHFPSIAQIRTALAEIVGVLKDGGELFITLDNKTNPVIALRNRLPFPLLNRLGILPYYVGATLEPNRLKKMLIKSRLDVLDVTAIMHFPRLVLVAAGRLFHRTVSGTRLSGLVNFFLRLEALSEWPSRFYTGHFTAARAMKRTRTVEERQRNGPVRIYRDSNEVSTEYQADIMEYVKALMHHGPSTYIDNARVEMRGAVVDDILFPIVMGDPGKENSNTCSPYTHFVRYTLEELIKRNRKIPYWLFQAILKSFGSILKRGDIDKVVYMNNYLFATNPHQRLSSRQIRDITACLIEKYPARAIVYPTINPFVYPAYSRMLQNHGYVLVKSRRIYMLDPSCDRFRFRTNVKLDMDLLDRTPYDIIGADELSDTDCIRMAALYRSLYLDKHSYLNPQLNQEFFRLTVEKRVLTYRVLKKDGQIDAFVNYYVRNGVLTGAFVGYDRNVPPKLGLYRQAVAILIRDAMERGLLLNLSAGVGRFKQLRGAFPVVEYMAVYHRHLPSRRRFPWFLVERQGDAWSLGL